MDDANSHYGLQLALQTMKDRCVQLQKRIATLEEENASLRLKNMRPMDLSQGSLELTVSKLTEEKDQLKSTIAMVASENKQLWSNLSRLTGIGENEANLGIVKISKASPLIRSRTFTQEAPHTKHLQKVLSENDKINLELEDISLKLQHSYSKEKSELEMQVFEMTSLKDAEWHSLELNYLTDEDVGDSTMIESIEHHLADLSNIKVMLERHNEILKSSVDHLADRQIKSKTEHGRSATKTVQVNMQEECKLHSPSQPPPTDWRLLERNADKICPMCSKKFHYDVDFEVFSRHVEGHFLESDRL